jgi:hypothetical protein
MFSPLKAKKCLPNTHIKCLNCKISKYTRIKNMAKNKMLKTHQDVEDDFDFSEMLAPSYDDYDDNETMADLMSGLIEASNNQMRLAIELTKLALDKNAAKDMNEDEVFSIFKKASAVIAESFPLKSLLENLPTNS